MYLGIDLGTSALKAIVVDGAQRIVAEQSVPLDVQRPRPLWSEQDPEQWWQAALCAVDALAAAEGAPLRGVRAIGLSGQMHGAVALDERERVLRPAILWNDGRSGPQCAELERRVPAARSITGNLAMPGFTAPKLLWMAEHEPELFARLSRVLLPKDYLRLRLTGICASDCSDAAGTLWLDVARRVWSEEMLEACGLSKAAMPALVEGSEVSGELRPELVSRWQLGSPTLVAGGGGDNAAGAVGVGVIESGQAFLSLGTSGVYFVAGDRFAPNPDSAVHAFCHCLPGRWHQMSVILSAAASLSWLCGITGARDEAALLTEVERADRRLERLLFLPYLSGERTPHNDPLACGVFFGLDSSTTRADLGRAVLEGVAFALRDGQDALEAAGTRIDHVIVIGGGAKSRYWGRILASALERPLAYRPDADLGPAFGAARLARLADTGEAAAELCRGEAAVEHTVEPDRELSDHYAESLPRFRGLYRELRDTMQASL